MPVEVKFREEDKLLHYVVTDPWDIPDLMAAYEDERAFRDQSDTVLHAVIDFSAAKNIPKNWLQARSGPGLTHPTGGEMIFVGLSSGLKILLDIILKLTRYSRFKQFESFDEALEYARTLPTEPRKDAEQVSS